SRDWNHFEINWREAERIAAVITPQLGRVEPPHVTNRTPLRCRWLTLACSFHADNVAAEVKPNHVVPLQILHHELNVLAGVQAEVGIEEMPRGEMSRTKATCSLERAAPTVSSLPDG